MLDGIKLAAVRAVLSYKQRKQLAQYAVPAVESRLPRNEAQDRILCDANTPAAAPIGTVTEEFFKDHRRTIRAQCPDASQATRTCKVYCAGPMFCLGDKLEMEQIANVLECDGFETYLPHRDGIEMGEVTKEFPRFLAMKGVTSRIVDFLSFVVQNAIFCVDLHALVSQCDMVVNSLNGRVPDEGASCEAAIAFAAGKPVVQYKRDVRSLIFGRDNPILTGLVVGPFGGHQCVEDVHHLPKVCRQTMEFYRQHDAQYDYLSHCHPLINPFVEFGKTVLRLRDQFIPKAKQALGTVERVHLSSDMAFDLQKYVMMEFVSALVLATQKAITVPERFRSIKSADLAFLMLANV